MGGKLFYVLVILGMVCLTIMLEIVEHRVTRCEQEQELILLQIKNLEARIESLNSTESD